jgi:hypothetical protein
MVVKELMRCAVTANLSTLIEPYHIHQLSSLLGGTRVKILKDSFKGLDQANGKALSVPVGLELAFASVCF